MLRPYHNLVDLTILRSAFGVRKAFNLCIDIVVVVYVAFLHSTPCKYFAASIDYIAVNMIMIFVYLLLYVIVYDCNDTKRASGFIKIKLQSDNKHLVGFLTCPLKHRLGTKKLLTVFPRN